MNTAAEKKVKRTYTGKVISDKMNKTIVVQTERTFVQKEFSKIMKTSKKYKVHDEKEQAQIGRFQKRNTCILNKLSNRQLRERLHEYSKRN